MYNNLKVAIAADETDAVWVKLNKNSALRRLIAQGPKNIDNNKLSEEVRQLQLLLEVNG